jgi:dephospho-CoA kinase
MAVESLSRVTEHGPLKRGLSSSELYLDELLGLGQNASSRGAIPIFRGDRKTALVTFSTPLGTAVSTVIGLSGRIAAGKTTAARWIEAMGYSYTRFSLVIDEEITSRGLLHDRSIRQQVGIEIHDERGQAWLCEQTIARVGGANLIVIDGLRWPEDRAYFVERFSSRFFHIHVNASADIRFERVGNAKNDRSAFDTADRQPTERMIDTLGQFAVGAIENVHSLAHFHDDLMRTIESLTS